MKYRIAFFIQCLISLIFFLPVYTYSQEYFIIEHYFIKDIYSCDIDLDGDNDLVISSSSNGLPDSLFIFYNDGIGNLNKTSIWRRNGIFVLCGNINIDQFPAIISRDTSGIIYIKNNGDGTFSEEITLAPNEIAMVIEYIADMDGDGLNDLVYTSNVYYCIWGILKNEGDLIFTDHIIYDDGMGGTLFPRIGYLNDDNLPDACLSYLPNGIHTLMNNGNLTFDTTLLCTTKASPRICKLNLTPPDDILIFSHNTDELILYENLGNNVFLNRNTLPLINALSSSHIADFNNDGYDDLCYSICWWSGCTDSIYVRINDQNWNFHKPQQYYVGPMEIFSTETADLNGDNFNDIIMYGYSPRNAFKILWNDGFGSFTYENPVGIGERPATDNKVKIDISPNPASDMISIACPDIININNSDIIILNTLGIEVKHVPAFQNDKEINVDISNLPVGLYFVVLKVDDRQVAEGKFLVLR